ncbi:MULTISPECIES: CinA family protein [Nocardia]|uniref:CinA family protein n=1 Tax=Nocardia TaxID=1817 RepID=UPI000D69673F|nr:MULTISPECIES: CinA family protein [Nocardia]
MSTVADDIAALATHTGLTIAVAESLTAGHLAAALGAAPDAAGWFRGGVVAYSRHVKHRVLGVPEGPVVCETSAAAMAVGVAALMEADLAVAVTGAGGPDPQDGHPPGSVWFAVAARGTRSAVHHRFDGGPEQVIDRTVEYALRLLLTAAEKIAAVDRTAGTD